MRSLVVYDTLCYPTPEKFLEFMMGSVKQGANALEVGIPPRYAKYDGPVIRRSYRAVSKFSSNAWEVLGELGREVDVDLIALTYLEDWLGNFNELVSKLKGSGVKGLLFPDLVIDFPFDVEKIAEKVRNAGLRNVIFVTPTVPDSFIKRVSKLADLFLYYGIRPTTGVPIPVSVDALLGRVRSLVESKLIVGFGLSNLEDVRKAIKAGADGIAVGTSLIEEMERSGIEGALRLVSNLREIVDGA